MTTPTTLPDHPYSNRDQSRYPNIRNIGSSASVTPGAISTASAVSGTVTVTGATLGDFVLCAYSVTQSGCMLDAYVSDGNTVTWVFSNPTGATITPGVGVVSLVVFEATQGVGII